ncbi:MAG: hypothetical protein KGN16_02390, partial [Burkholderiales bacterium]|nr:hypothetical protein [Burkholderiales bacterium]
MIAPRCKVLVALLVAAVSAPAAAAGAPAVPGAPVVIAAPHYGAVLFDFYLDRPFDALGDLMVSQHFDRLGGHRDEAELLRGGLLLDAGAPRAAAAIFTQLIDGGAPASIRDRAWFLLARSQHERGDGDAAAAAIARIGAPLAGGLEDERQLLAARLLSERGDDAGAARLLAAAAEVHPANALLRYNLALAWLRSAGTASGEGPVARALALLEAIGSAPAEDDEEARALRDRANLALGTVALRLHEPERARAALQRVRLHGDRADAALLAA